MKNVEMSLVNIESLPKLMHDYLECYLVVRGTAVAEVDGREYPMGEDDMIIIHRKIRTGFWEMGTT